MEEPVIPAEAPKERWILAKHQRGSWYYFRSSLDPDRYSRSFWITFLQDGSITLTGDWEPYIWKRKFQGNLEDELELDIFPVTGTHINYWIEKVRTSFTIDAGRVTFIFNMICQAMDIIAETEGLTREA